jgi:hypothetical protein
LETPGIKRPAFTKSQFFAMCKAQTGEDDMPTVKTEKKTAKPAPRAAKKASFENRWEAIERGFVEIQKAHKETEKALKETQRIVGDLGNRFGDIAERMLVPGLLDKFEQFGFSFGELSHNVKWKEKEHNLSMELDALLENGKQAMLVEVKAKLDKTDIDEQIRRMEKVRRYADLKGDKRQFFCALAALTAPDRVIEYALSKGFYMIMPSGEDVNVTKPVSGPMVW